VNGTLPYRGDGTARPPEVVLPPARLPLLREGRPLKRWRYVGAYGERLMLCAASVQIGPLRQAFWAVWDRERRALRERTRLRRTARHVRVGPGRVRVSDGQTDIDLVVEEERRRMVETASAHGASWIWTRKQGGVRVHGRVTLGGEEIAFDAPGCVDDTVGYHARETAWTWAAGVGEASDGRALAWNLVDGVHDAPEASERTLWVDGEPREVGPVRFAAGLDAIAFAGGAELRFAAEAVRERHDDLLVFASEYAQPFGAFSGTLPGGIELASGRGVMERHAARW
jgi:hypothetical protein